MRRNKKLIILLFIAAASVPAVKAFKQRLHARPSEMSGRFPATTQENSLPQISTPDSPCTDIYQLVCQKKGPTYDPTGMVTPDIEGERQALRLYREIIQKYQRDPQTYQMQEEQKVDLIAEELVREIFNPKRRGRILSAFHWVKQTMIRLIDQQPDSVFTAQEKRKIKMRLRKTQLEIPPPASVYADEPDLLTKNEVYYERTASGKMRLRVGGAYVFIAKSWFNLIFTLGHELAHSIDPCEIRAARISLPAYDRLTACFLQNGLIVTYKTRSECGNHDQLSETFADWIAVQVTSEALRTFSTEFHPQQIINAARNSVRDLCDQDEENTEIDTLFHPSPRTRIEKIFGSNSTIRQLLGCRETAPADCSFGPSQGTP